MWQYVAETENNKVGIWRFFHTTKHLDVERIIFPAVLNLSWQTSGAFLTSWGALLIFTRIRTHSWQIEVHKSVNADSAVCLNPKNPKLTEFPKPSSLLSFYQKSVPACLVRTTPEETFGHVSFRSTRSSHLVRRHQKNGLDPSYCALCYADVLSCRTDQRSRWQNSGHPWVRQAVWCPAV